MRVAREEIFGPVLSVIRVDDLDEALAIGRDCPYGNGASIFTRSGWAARQFKHHFNAGMIGINVGVPAPMAWFPFTGWNSSFFGDLHIQGTEAVQFYTQQKMTMTRWFESPKDSHHRPGLEDGQGLRAPRFLGDRHCGLVDRKPGGTGGWRWCPARGLFLGFAALVVGAS